MVHKEIPTMMVREMQYDDRGKAKFYAFEIILYSEGSVVFLKENK